MNFSCYISFDLTGITDGSSWTVQENQPTHGNWAVNAPPTLNGGQSYGESVATGTSGNANGSSSAQLADLTGFEGSQGTITLTGPMQGNSESVTLTLSFQCPTGLSANQAGVQFGNNIANAYTATYYCCSDTPSSSNQYVNGNVNSGHPYYIIFALSSVQ